MMTKRGLCHSVSGHIDSHSPWQHRWQIFSAFFHQPGSSAPNLFLSINPPFLPPTYLKHLWALLLPVANFSPFHTLPNIGLRTLHSLFFCWSPGNIILLLSNFRLQYFSLSRIEMCSGGFSGTGFKSSRSALGPNLSLTTCRLHTLGLITQSLSLCPHLSNGNIYYLLQRINDMTHTKQ